MAWDTTEAWEVFARHTLLVFSVDDRTPRFIQTRDITGEMASKGLSVVGMQSPVPYNVDVLAREHPRAEERPQPVARMSPG